MPGRDRRSDLWIDLYLAFRGELRDVLASGDLDVARAFLRESGRQLGDVDLRRLAGLDDARLQVLIARLTLADPRLLDHHRRARHWLRRCGAAGPRPASGYGRPNVGSDHADVRSA